MAQVHVIPDAPQRAVPWQNVTIGVVGSGTLGSSIAELAAIHGFAVRRVRDAADPSELANSDVVIEATPGDARGKGETVRRLEAGLPRASVLAIHTPGVSVTRLAAGAKHPQRIVGLHFVQSTGSSEIVEVVRAVQTSAAAYDETCRVLGALGKTLVRAEDRPGFLVHRLQIPFINEACFALQEGVGSVEDIDAAARLGMGHSTGPLRMADTIGLDQCLLIAERLHREFGEAKYRPTCLLKNYVAAGWLGRKTGRGFYVYPRGV